MANASKMTSAAPLKFGDEYDRRQVQALEAIVRQQAQAMRRLESLLIGGTPGQVLTKTSSKDFEGEWRTP
jgi:hypothetical protein